MEEATLWIHSQEGGNVLVVRKSGRESYKADHLGSRFDLTDGTSNQCFQNWSSQVVQQMNLINDDQFYKLKIGTISALSCDDVPLLWGCHDDLGLFNL